jgi:hypothetical protein
LSERAANNQGVIGTAAGANPYGNNDNNALPHLHSSAPWPVSLMAGGVRPGVVNPGSTAVLGAIPQAGSGHSYWGGAAGSFEPIGPVPPSGGGGGSPGGVSGDYQINNGAGGFGAASMNQTLDGTAKLVPSSPADAAQIIIRDNAQLGLLNASVANDGSEAGIILTDSAGNTVIVDSIGGVRSDTGIFDHNVRQFLGIFTVAGLPGGHHAGDTAAVSDATAPILGSAPVGLGAVFCRVIWTGSIWVCG